VFPRAQAVVLLRSWHAAVTGRTCPPPPSAGWTPFVDHERSVRCRTLCRTPPRRRTPAGRRGLPGVSREIPGCGPTTV